MFQPFLHISPSQIFITRTYFFCDPNPSHRAKYEIEFGKRAGILKVLLLQVTKLGWSLSLDQEKVCGNFHKSRSISTLYRDLRLKIEFVI